MTEQQEREAFEAWASDQGHVIVRLWGDYSRQGVYVDLRTEGAWEAWQARAALAATPAPAPLTREQIDKIMTKHFPLDSMLRENVDAFEACVRDVERELGIGQGKEASK